MKRELARVTLGQLKVLSDLGLRCDDPAQALSKQALSVNQYQKLQRLENGLEQGALTEKKGRLVLTDTGRRVVNEFKAFLDGIKSDGNRELRIHLAAADTWIHSVILPSLRDFKSSSKDFKFKVSNLNAQQVVAGICDGSIHFGVLRASERASVPTNGDLRIFDGSKPKKPFPYVLLAGSKCGLRSKQLASCIAKLLESRASLFQHGGRWPGIRRAYNEKYGPNQIPDYLEPTIDCGTHLQAALAVRGAKAWCVVPDVIAKIVSSSDVICLPFPFTEEADELILIRRLGIIKRLADGEAAFKCIKEILFPRLVATRRQ